MPTVRTGAPETPGQRGPKGIVRGLLAAGAIAAIAYPLGHAVPALGAPVFSLILGIGIATTRQPGPALAAGISFVAKYVLQGAIVTLGATLSLSEVARVGSSSLPVMLGTLLVALASAALVGRLLDVSARFRALIGVGTGICGASAIAAISGIIEATDAEIAYAITTIFVFNIVAVVVFPLIGHALGLSQHTYGLWAGTAVNDTSSVVAAAYAFGRPAGAYAIIVKLTRTTLIIPIAAALAVWKARRGARASTRWTAIVPWFLLWFLAASAVDTAGLLTTSARHLLARLAVAFITIALAAVGLSTRISAVRTTGLRPLLLGAVTWIGVAGSSLALQRLTGT